MDLIIYGASDFAKLMLHYFRTQSTYNVVAFCVDVEYFSNERFEGLPVFSFEEIQSILSPSNHHMFVAIGYSNMRIRKSMYAKAKDKGYTLANFISPAANVDTSVQIGDNNVILQGANIEPFVKIGSNNIFWTSSLVCHDTTVHSHSFFAAKSMLGGFSKIENNCFIGFNATIIQNTTVAEETLVGANSLILKDTSKFSKMVGSPAKLVDLHEELGIKIQ